MTISDFLLEEDMTSSNVVSKRPARPLVLVCRRLDEKKEKSDVCLLLLLTEKSSKIHPQCVPPLFLVVVGVGVVGVALEHELYRHSASKDEEVLALALVLCASQRA